MQCPHCHRIIEIKSAQEDRVMMDLRYIAKHRMPLFKGVIERGLTDQDSTLKLLLERGLIKQQGNEGFVVTEKGRQVAA